MKIHSLEGQIQTIFIAEYPDRLLLLDCGTRADGPLIIDFIKNRLKRSISELTLAVVTHMHPDHAGSAAWLRKKHGVALAAPTKIDRWYSGFGGFLQHVIDIYLAQFVVFRQRRPYRCLWHPRFVRADHELEDGEILPGFDDWQVLSLPGHTSHDIVLYHRESRTLYASDSMVIVKGRFALPIPILLPDHAYRSLDRLEGLPFENVHLAHGGTRTIPGKDKPYIFQQLRERIPANSRSTPLLSILTNLPRDITRLKMERHENRVGGG